MRILALALALGLSAPAVAQDRPDWAIVIHGGAGVIERESMTPETEAAYRAAMEAAVTRGRDVLEAGGSSLDTVEAVIQGLDDASPLVRGAAAWALSRLADRATVAREQHARDDTGKRQRQGHAQKGLQGPRTEICRSWA